MAVDLSVPEWLQIKCSAWIDRLRMHEWDVAIGLALVVKEDPDTRACAEQYPDISFGRITFRADVEDTQEWEATLVHELLHIRHSRIDNYIDSIVLPRLQGVEMGFGYMVYRSHLEPFTESLAQALVSMVRVEKKPYSYQMNFTPTAKAIPAKDVDWHGNGLRGVKVAGINA